MTRFFHLLSDRKTVRELDWDDYQKLARQNFRHVKKKMFCVLHDNEIYFFKHNGITVPLRQLREVLKE